MRLATAEAFTGAPAVGARPVVPLAPGALSPAALLRSLAADVERHAGPHPVTGMRAWLDGERIRDAVEFPARGLVAGERVEELMAAAAARWGGSPHANAALVWKSYCYWTVAPVVLGWLAGRRVPVMDAAHTVFSVSAGSPAFAVRQTAPEYLVLPHDPFAARPGAQVAADEADLLERMRVNVLDRHLEPVLEEFLARVRIGRRTMMGSLASGLAYAAASFAPLTHEPAEVVAKTLLDAFDVAHLVDVSTDETGRLAYTRRTCCLRLTIDGERTCANCCVQTDRC